MIPILSLILFASPVLPPPTAGSMARHRTRPAACATCHPLGLTAVRAADLIAPSAGLLRAPPALHFSHRTHAQRGVECAACHPGGALPTKDQCAECHDVRAPNRCQTCHLQTPEGRLQTDLAYGSLRPIGRSGPDHRGTFARTHKAAAQAEGESCTTCHAPPDCQRCHLGRLRPLSIHPGDYLTQHGSDARRGTPDCGTCHRRQSFCTDCHAQSGLMQKGGAHSFGADQPDRTRFHPAGFVGRLGQAPEADHHRYAARRALGSCVSCHRESDCVRCHSDRTTARLRASPHPRDFRRRCGSLRASNPRSCIKCHDKSRLDGLCR